MVDARFPERLLSDRRLMKLSDADIVSYAMATIWSVSNRTDGCILAEELSLIPRFHVEAAPRLVTAELWRQLGAGYVILDHEAWQTSKADLEVLENARRREREKKARQRQAKKDVPGDKTGDRVSFPSEESRGTQAGTAQEGQASTSGIQKLEEVWPEVATIGRERMAS